MTAAIQAKRLKSDRSAEELALLLHAESKRDWNIFASRKVHKEIVINHIGRYIRRPPIAQYRFTRLNENEVQYLAKDTRNKCLRPVTYTNQEFLEASRRSAYRGAKATARKSPSFACCAPMSGHSGEFIARHVEKNGSRRWRSIALRKTEMAVA